MPIVRAWTVAPRSDRVLFPFRVLEQTGIRFGPETFAPPVPLTIRGVSPSPSSLGNGSSLAGHASPESGQVPSAELAPISFLGDLVRSGYHRLVPCSGLGWQSRCDRLAHAREPDKLSGPSFAKVAKGEVLEYDRIGAVAEESR